MKSIPALASPLLLLLLPNLTLASPLYIRPHCDDNFIRCKGCPVELVADWTEIGMHRFRHTVDLRLDVDPSRNDTINDHGLAFLYRARCHDGGGIVNNWAWWGPDDQGKYTFDISEVQGYWGGDVLKLAIGDVTGV